MKIRVYLIHMRALDDKFACDFAVMDQRVIYGEISKVKTNKQKIEAINSRSLSPLSSDPTDFAPLTPGHCLIGRAVASISEPDVTSVACNRLNQFERIRQIQQHFWKRWHTEYINELQQRLMCCAVKKDLWCLNAFVRLLFLSVVDIWTFTVFITM